MPAKERMLAQGKAVTTAVTTAQTVTAGKRPPRCDQRWAKGVLPSLSPNDDVYYQMMLITKLNLITKT